MKNKWIYLKSNNPADALALSTVLCSYNETIHIVRRSNFSQFFSGLNNVVVDFYKSSEENEIITIDEIVLNSWTQKCDAIATYLNIDSVKSYEPYSGFLKKNKEIETRLKEDNNCLLCLYPHPEENIDLMIIDQLVRLLNSQNITSISGGTSILPCIKNTIDFRQLIDFSILCSILPRMLFVITTETSIATICEAFNKKAFVLSNTGRLEIDGLNMSDSNQILNYINLTIAK